MNDVAAAFPDLSPEECARIAAGLVPAPARRYQGSGLERFHQDQRAAADDRAAERARYAPEMARLVAAHAAARPQRRAALVRFHAAKRRACRIQRTPPWADLAAIRAIYDEAHRLTVETGVPHHVDHDFPLQGELVSGLHVETNLQILTGAANVRKGNRWSPC